MPTFDVVGLGVSPLDMLYRVEHFLAHEGVQQALEMVIQGGGPVATALVTLAKLGAKTAMIDLLGDDWRAAHIRAEFEAAGVSTAYLVQRPGHLSATAVILVRQADGARTIVHYPGTAPELSPAELPKAVIQSAKILHLNGRHWDAALQAVAWARESGVQVSFDGGAHRFRPALKKLVPLTDICIVARHFAAQYTGLTDIEPAGQALLKAGPGLVVITAGLEGSWVFSRDGQQFHQPAFKMARVVDTTGCGDSYHGAFLLGLVQGWALKKTAVRASAVAALNSQQLGGRAGLPTPAQLEAFLACQNEAE